MCTVICIKDLSQNVALAHFDHKSESDKKSLPIMTSMAKAAQVGQEKHPKGNHVDIQYGTAGFRTK
jgi:hypothetical protein